MSASNVLRVNSAQETTDYMDAVSEIIRRLIATPATLIEISEAIDVSLGTISNAFNKRAVLNPIYLNRLARKFGTHVLDPFAALSGGRVIPIEADEAADALPPVSAIVHKLTLVRTPGHPVHTELLGMEVEIDAAIRALTALKVRAQNIRSAA